MVKTRCALLVAGACAAALAAPAPSATAAPLKPDRVGRALAISPLYVDPEFRPRLRAIERIRIRRLIALRDPGRILVAVITPAHARAEGGLRDFGNAVSVALTWHGALLLVTGPDAYVITEYSDSNRALPPLNRAFNGRGSLANQLLRAVSGLATVDPERLTGERGARRSESDVDPVPAPAVPSGGPVSSAPRPVLPSGTRKAEEDSAGEIILGLAILGAGFAFLVWVIVRGVRWLRRRALARAGPSLTPVPTADMSPSEGYTASTEELHRQANAAFGRTDD